MCCPGGESHEVTPCAPGPPSSSETCAPQKEESGEAVQKRFLTGMVTTVTADGGMVNDYVYFEMGVVLGGAKAEVGDMVQVEAERKHSRGGWMASR